MFASRIVRAEPRKFPVAIFLMNRGTSMCVGQAAVQGASKQNKQREASTAAACGAKGGRISANRSANSSGVSLGTRLRFSVQGLHYEGSGLGKSMLTPEQQQAARLMVALLSLIMASISFH